jgi:acyl-CoA thioesterase FadM
MTEVAPVSLHQVTVPSDWVDYHGHMSEAYYLMVLSDSLDPLFNLIGCDAAYRAAGHSLYSVSWRLDLMAEVRMGDDLVVRTVFVGCDSKRLHMCHSLVRGAAETVAEAEHVMMHVDIAAGRSASMRQPLVDRIADLVSHHANLPRTRRFGMALRGA